MKKVLAVCLALLLTAPLPLLGGLADGPAGAAKTEAVLDEFEINGDGDALVLPFAVGAKTYHLELDTGAAYTVFDKSLRPILGRPVEGTECETPNGATHLDLFQPPKARVGKIPFQVDGPVATCDLSRMRAISGLETDGFLGTDFLRRHIVRIDFDAGRLAFLRETGTDAGEALDVSFDLLNCPSVQGTLPVWGSEPFLIDTGMVGYGSGSLGSLAFRSVLDSGRLRLGRDGRAIVASGDYKMRQGRVETLEVGKSSHRDLTLDEASFSLLSLSYWSRYTVTLDFPHNKVYLKPGKRFAAPDKTDVSGLHVWRPQGETVIESVEGGSPGRSAGLETGDVILTVSGQKAAEMRLFQLRRRLCERGDTVPMRVRRGGEEREVTLVLGAWKTGE